MKSLFRGRLHIFQIHHSGRKIGQCAVGVVNHKNVFLDKLILIPEADALWGACMHAVLKHLGPGIYEYGWNLNLEIPREDILGAISGVTIKTARPITVHAVDFQKWRSFEEYWADTSNNTRRNAKRAEAGSFKIVTRANSRGLLHLGAVVRLRASMYERKGIKFHQFRALMSYVVDHLIAADYRITAIASDGTRPLAAFTGCEFGSHTYYLAGGSQSNNNGIAWYLQKVMLQRAWNRTDGKAKFVMGHVDYATHNEDTGGGLLRARRAINVSEYATSIVTFVYKEDSSEQT
ncbi:hypothetical protein [Microvirga rosea]|uniref:hypothetical protein n=1 Tax=Microvirga rosea TaxID=2715425 RepID=UPI001D0A854F|nr:hypothetical protein [Microvirga rosea]MCB8818924.1 hypothetical protein [Microvirga rosea]